MYLKQNTGVVWYLFAVGKVIGWFVEGVWFVAIKHFTNFKMFNVSIILDIMS